MMFIAGHKKGGNKMEHWQIGDQAEVVSTSFDDDQRKFSGQVGKVIDIKTAEFPHFSSTDIRVVFEDGYETWLPAEDCVAY